MIKAGIVGATGYTGIDLLKILTEHAQVQVECLTTASNNGRKINDIFPHLRGIDMLCEDISPVDMVKRCDVVFTATPHGGASLPYAKECVRQGKKIIDLSADFRLRNRSVYEEWYEVSAPGQDLLDLAVYGLPELYGERIKKTSILANPGCYTTASILANAPLIACGLIDENSIIIDAKSGTSGAGRSAKVPNLFCEVNEGIRAYGVTTHRHTPEIEQELSLLAGKNVKVTFTPHLVPMNRGILAVSYSKIKKDLTEDELTAVYKDFYKNAPFVRVLNGGILPNTRYTAYTNYVDIAVKKDARTERYIIISSLDNLLKGAAGQAVQNMNLMFGFDETEGLKNFGFYP